MTLVFFGAAPLLILCDDPVVFGHGYLQETKEIPKDCHIACHGIFMWVWAKCRYRYNQNTAYGSIGLKL